MPHTVSTTAITTILSRYLTLYDSIHQKLALEDYDKYTSPNLRESINRIAEFRRSLAILSDLLPGERDDLELLEKKFRLLQLDVEERLDNFLKAQSKICQWCNSTGEISNYEAFSKWFHNFQRGFAVLGN